MNSSSFKGNSIHTLGRGSLSKINQKFPVLSSPTKQGSGDNSSGITTEITTKEEESIAQHCNRAAIAISSMSNIKIGDEDGASKVDKGNSNEPITINNEEDNSPSKMGFSAKLKMFGAMQQQHQKRDSISEQFISNDIFDSKRSSIKPSNDMLQSKKSTADQVSANENDTSAATKTPSPRLSSPVGAKKRMANFLKSRKSIESASSPPSSQYQAVEDGNGSQDIEDNTLSHEDNNTSTKSQEKQGDTPKTLSKTSVFKSKSSTKQVVASAAAVPNSSISTPSNEDGAVSSSQSPDNNKQPPIDKMKTQGMKKIASIKQQIKQSSPQRQPKPKQPKPTSSSPTKQSTQLNSRNIPQKKNPIPTTQSHRNKSNKKPTSNMIKAKSHQRLVLEQVASQYFLSERNQQRNNKYVGVVDYGCDGDVKGSGVSSALGNIIDESSKADADENVDREAVVEFLEGHIQTGDEDDDGFVVSAVSAAISSSHFPAITSLRFS